MYVCRGDECEVKVRCEITRVIAAEGNRGRTYPFMRKGVVRYGPRVRVRARCRKSRVLAIRRHRRRRLARCRHPGLGRLIRHHNEPNTRTQRTF